MSVRVLFLDHLDLQGDGHLFTHGNAAGFKGRIPDQAEVLAVDLGGGRGAATDVAPRVLALFGRSFHIKHNLLGHAVQGQVAR